MKIIVLPVVQPFADVSNPDLTSFGDIWARVVAIMRSVRKQISEGTSYAFRKSFSEQRTLDQTRRWHEPTYRWVILNIEISSSVTATQHSHTYVCYEV